MYKLSLMKKLVKYIGGQDKWSRKVCPLELNKVYTVEESCKGKFGGIWKEAFYLKETQSMMKDLVFLRSLFVDVTPKKIDVSDIRKHTHFEILNFLN